MDSHAITERANLIRHRLYAEHITRDSSLLDRAADWIERAETSGNGTVGTRMWQHILRMPACTVIEHMLDEGEVGQLLRSNSPFSMLIGQTDLNERRRTWQLAKSELSATGTRK